MKSWSILFNKLLITLSNLCFLVTIVIYPLFNFARQFKYNVAAFITLMANQNPDANNSLFNKLLQNNGYVNYFVLGVFLILQITYLFPLWFLKKPFSVCVLNFYQLMINILFIIILGFFFNWFSFDYFNAIGISDLLILPFLLLAVNLGLTFNFAVFYFAKHISFYPSKNLAKNPIVIENEIQIETPDVETLNQVELQSKINDLKVILNK